MLELRRSLRVGDGLAMVIGIMVGSGIFRTPGLVAGQLGRPGLTLVAWLVGGAIAFAGNLIFASSPRGFLAPEGSTCARGKPDRRSGVQAHSGS